MSLINLDDSFGNEAEVDSELFTSFKEKLMKYPHYDEEDAERLTLFIYLNSIKNIKRRDIFELVIKLYSNNITVDQITELKDSDVLFLLDCEDIIKGLNELDEKVSISFNRKRKTKK